MNEMLDRSFREYRFEWQARFSNIRKQLGPTGAMRAQHYVSILRAMRRRLSKGGKPSLRDFKKHGRTSPRDFVEKRLNQRFVRAIDRGERREAIVRRGLMNRSPWSRCTPELMS